MSPSSAAGSQHQHRTPALNDRVLFHEDGGPYAATITALNPDGTVDLVTFGRNSVYFQHNISMGGPDGRTPSKGTYTWL